MAAHKEIKIKFEVEDRRFEAVGFLNEEEMSTDGDERTGEAIGEEDEAFLSERRGKIPVKLQRYYLVTGRRHPDYPRDVSFFYFYGDGWCQDWYWLGDRRDGYCLVGRR